MNTDPRLLATEFREKLADSLSRVAYGNERIVLVRNGKDVAALVPMRDLESLLQLENDRVNQSKRCREVVAGDVGGDLVDVVVRLRRSDDLRHQRAPPPPAARSRTRALMASASHRCPSPRSSCCSPRQTSRRNSS